MGRAHASNSPLERRASGILLHPTSLWGPFGSGDLGPAAFDFAVRMAEAGQRWWQMLPVGPAGGADSPYDSPSTFAGNPELVSLELVARDGWLRPDEILPPRSLARARSCAFEAARPFHRARLKLAAERFFAKKGAHLRRYDEFCEHARDWLGDWVLFDALTHAHHGRPWHAWDTPLRVRRSAALERAAQGLDPELRLARFIQYLFDVQWRDLRRHCGELGVLLLGDVPMFVSGNSADTWSHQDLFLLDARGRQRVQVGVPPDDFAPDGQRWGNPAYDWAALKRSGFRWWIERLRKTLDRFDAVRLDHFIGLYRYWQLPADATTACLGRFVRVPGSECLRTARHALGGLPCVAEDLGLRIPEVDALRDEFGLPGMRVLEFGFSAAGHYDRPHFFPENCVAYTGTHDNDTLLGWLRAKPGRLDDVRAHQQARRFALDYAGCGAKDFHWGSIRAVMASRASTTIFPLQDLLGLGSAARMNVPGTSDGNWRWRVNAEAFDRKVRQKARGLSVLYDRARA